MLRKTTKKIIIGTFIPDEFDFIELSDNDLSMSMFMMLRDKRKNHMYKRTRNY